MIIVIWIAAVLGIIVWSLFAWGLHALLSVDPGWVGNFAPLVDQVPYSGLLSYWVPGWPEFMHASLAATQGMLGWLGAAAPTLVVVMWLIGAVLLLGGAALSTLVVGLLRRRRQRFAYAR